MRVVSRPRTWVDTPEELLAEADRLFDEADEALRGGDLGRYQDLVSQARARVDEAVSALAGGNGDAGTSGGGAGDPDPDYQRPPRPPHRWVRPEVIDRSTFGFRVPRYVAFDVATSDRLNLPVTFEN